MPKFYQPASEVWAKFNLDSGYLDSPALKLLIKPSLRKEVILSAFSKLDSFKKKNDIPSGKEIAAAFEESVQRAMELIVDWDLTDEENNPISLSDEKGKKCLENLMWEDIKKNEKKKKKEIFNWLWIEVLKFSSDIKNFIKN